MTIVGWRALASRVTPLLLACSPAISAQSIVADGATDVVIDTKSLGKRTVRVVTPDGYATTTTRYPVAVMLDGNASEMFDLARANARYVAGNEAGVPPVILVGIINGADRIHDMTPPPTGSSRAEFPTGGGADAFADFLIDEVLPMIRGRYRALPTAILIGHSAGGLFALHVAATRAGAFQAVVAVSPALWYNDSTPSRIYADMIARSRAPLRLFTASGALEQGIDYTTRRFAARLDSIRPPHVAFAHRRYTDDTHSMTFLSGVAEGLRYAFDPLVTRRLPIARLKAGDDSATVVRALLASETQYAEAAKPLLMPPALQAVTVNRVGNFVLRALKDTALAVWVLERNLVSNPETLGARDILADIYLARGDTARALTQLRKADEAARAAGATLPHALQGKLGRLEGRGS